jgi:hypothetical protein
VVTGIAVFVAVAVPFLVYAFTRPGGTSGYWVALGLGFGAIAGLVVGLVLASGRR